MDMRKWKNFKVKVVKGEHKPFLDWTCKNGWKIVHPGETEMFDMENPAPYFFFHGSDISIRYSWNPKIFEDHPFEEYTFSDLGISTRVKEKTEEDITLETLIGVDKFIKFPRVSRVEVIDKDGRSYTRRGDIESSISIQDEGRTLKIFIKEK